MQRMKKIGTIAAAAALVVGLGACDEPGGDSDAKARSNAHGSLQKKQPAKTMKYSPTRETINYWVETWDEPGKLSYVYLQSSSGKMIGYYVLEGLPVSYCAQISPNTELRSRGSEGMAVVPAPANDGAYYGGGGSCNTYYGKDATTGSYVEYTAGMGINVLLFDQPMPNNNAPALGKTSVADVKAKGKN